MFSNMSHPATVSDFRLDHYLVTVGRFRAFLAAGGGMQSAPPEVGAGSHKQIPNSGWDSSWNQYLATNETSLGFLLNCDPSLASWTDKPGPNEYLPLNCVPWYLAMAYCISQGGYLPTNAEHNYAASGGDEQRAYPWSSPAGSLAIDCTDAAYKDTAGTCSKLSVVGSKPAGDGRWGQSDLSGNLQEWLLDYDVGFPTHSYIDPCVDCAQLMPDPNFEQRVVRGGYF